MRHRRIRRRMSGTEGCPRLSVFRSSRHIYAQLVDDATGRVLAALSSLSPAVRGEVATAEKGGKPLKPTQLSHLVGKLLATKAREQGIERVSFDRGGYLYHGRVKALAEGSREGGLRF